ncbi:MAG: HAD-IC family P-type ATPase [Armatimonadetes bacterium]|nr:HAD-IC family P-type ATPase [Armatimonadota bacterium]
MTVSTTTAERLENPPMPEEKLGLTTLEARQRLARHGPNRLPEPPPASLTAQVIEQVASPLVLTLLAAAVVATINGFSQGGAATFLERFGDALAIGAIVVLNAFLGVFQERRAQSALHALQRMVEVVARVRRDGQSVMIPASEIVPGDVIEIQAGDAVAADAVLLRAAFLATQESALTGESTLVEKSQLPADPQTPPLERHDRLFAGTNVVRGSGLAEVLATGEHTELGRIGVLMRGIAAEKTPLQAQLERFGRSILWICLALSAALMAWGWLQGGRTLSELLLQAVSLAVAAIPEGLPAITTITLALGLQRMARRGALVRRLSAVETLGAATVICTDKTGTLTRNEMSVREAWWPGNGAAVIRGEGYAPLGEVDGGTIPDALLACAALCNDARIRCDESGAWRALGDPTEAALVALVERAGRPVEALRASHPRLAEFPFDTSRKRMAVVVRDGDGSRGYVKGAVEALLPLCADEEATLATAAREAERMAAAGMRVLLLAWRTLDVDGHETAESVERDLHLAGLVGMLDPPRDGVPEAVAGCRAAGVQSIMITGDHPATARAIASDIGLWQPGDEILSGQDLGAFGTNRLAGRVDHIRIFARTTAEQKLEIVRALKRRNHVVAMTGDGVNDAPALREAHIGVAMGRSGTDVAREAADLVLADDNYATIVAAVREGRGIYRNIQKFIFFLLSSNAGLVIAVFVASLFPHWPPLTPLMILWINLVTNALPALALGVDHSSAEIMAERPRSADQALMQPRDYLGIAYVGTVMAVCALVPYFTEQPEIARTMSFGILALSPLFHAWSSRSPVASAFSGGLNRMLVLGTGLSALLQMLPMMLTPLGPVFHTQPLDPRQWLAVLSLSAAIVPAVEIAKFAVFPQMHLRKHTTTAS